MRELERRLRAKGCVKINLLVEPENADVIPFYERLGFHPRSLIFMDKWIAEPPDRQTPPGPAGSDPANQVGRPLAKPPVPPAPHAPPAPPAPSAPSAPPASSMSPTSPAASVSAWTGIEPALHAEPYVFVTLPEPPPGLDAFAVIREGEGVTLVVTRDEAERAGLPSEYVAARVTLTISSSLSAVGLTAEVSRVLADAGISCNVIAGFRHDHLFVDWDRGAEAAALLRGL